MKKTVEIRMARGKAKGVLAKRSCLPREGGAPNLLESGFTWGRGAVSPWGGVVRKGVEWMAASVPSSP
jgi:hypothetical protein